MAKKKEDKKNFPWHTPKRYRWRYYTGGRTRFFSGDSMWDAHTARFFHALFGVPWILCGILSIPDIPIMIICFSVTGISWLIALYAHLSIRENEKFAAEEQAARDEKQRLWREKRRTERAAKKKRK